MREVPNCPFLRRKCLPTVLGAGLRRGVRFAKSSTAPGIILGQNIHLPKQGSTSGSTGGTHKSR